MSETRNLNGILNNYINYINIYIYLQSLLCQS